MLDSLKKFLCGSEETTPLASEIYEAGSVCFGFMLCCCQYQNYRPGLQNYTVPSHSEPHPNPKRATVK